jgi:hypothetical protein
MNRGLYILLLAFASIAMVGCFKESSVLEKGAGYYIIEERKTQIYDSSFNLQSETTSTSFGSLTLFAKSGGVSSGSFKLKEFTWTFPKDTIVNAQWEVAPRDESRLIFSKVFTMTGWGSNRVTLTYLKSKTEREVFVLKRK